MSGCTRIIEHYLPEEVHCGAQFANEPVPELCGRCAQEAFARLQCEIDAAVKDVRRIDAIEHDPHILAHIRTGRNLIGVPTGGWLWSETFYGPETSVLTFRDALDAVLQRAPC